MARFTSLSAYVRSPAAIIDPANPAYVAEELQRVEDVVGEMVLMIPQPAIAPPKTLRDGMQRLARAPWRPIGGTVDRWVYFDAPTGAWKALNSST